MKKWGKILLSCAIVLGSAAGGAAAPFAQAASTNQVKIMLDNYPLPFPVEPVVISGTTMVPFRAISEALGINVVWNQKAKKITASKLSDGIKKTVELTLGSKTAKVNGQNVSLTLAPRTISNTTMIPLSFFSQQFGAGVGWNQASKTVSITSPREEMYTLGYYALRSFDEISYLHQFDAAAFGWSRIDREGHFTLTGDEYRWPAPSGEITGESIINDAASEGTTPYLMVYSVDGMLELTKNLEDKELRSQTIDSIMEAATEKGFKGIALDLEGLGMTGDKSKVKSDYNAFVKELSSRAKQQDMKLTVIVHALNSVYQGYDYKTLANFADDLVLMAYAYGDEKSPEPVAKVDEAIQLALKQVDKDKLILGISRGSETAASINTKIGLAKRYDLKGIALWRLGIIGPATWAEMNKTIVLD
ncbi:stalk domain-containing protein [Paenibacillus urinalis]|uniref:Stalk domain-containing protein n=1 Tax=Paenibacillus urinalis TaxID=521520 RepID=A0AAX3N7H0_9BACL|nr:stalk domain-containing protein [Paenibacillus urinalis]WDH84949.1 stalk domain-containing protein [Paenibacillus urinalis]WDH96411.1 stalk domain-containing protein [Paenibacillus urinalis]WDI04633.1 stalk domain-containing protein [Paenibacillus urinalis]